MNPLKAASIHEAGHCTIATHYGLKLASVELSPDGSGVTRFAEGVGDFESSAWGTILLAGLAAEQVYAPNPHMQAHAEGDFSQAAQLCAAMIHEDLANPAVARFVAGLTTLAKALVVLHESPIRRVADQLLVSRRLDAAQLSRLIVKRR
jgi:Peptidase M50B-like